ncbi:MAG: hypothetical protein BM565_14465 [Gammaproteobacteria bacterium MedPE]|nr:MAG: hypothetical protein BM565_14465 [Gammaproteobacteria bacterium MedPE]
MINIDERLIKKLKAGDKAAQEVCYISLSPTIYTTLVKICRDREIANDLLHDTFIQLFDTAITLDSNINLIAWVKKIAINKAFNYIKRSKLSVLEFQPRLDDYLTEGRNDSDMLDRLLASLPAEQRVVVWLFIVEGYSHAKIGHFVQKSESYSKSVLSRCLNKFRCQIGDVNESY